MTALRRLSSILIFACLLIWFLTTPAFSQQFLEPEDGRFSMKTDLEFYGRLYDAMFKDHTPFVIARTVCIPFDASEWAVSVVLRFSPVEFPSIDPPLDTSYSVVAVKAQKPIGVSSVASLKEKIARLKQANIKTYSKKIAAEDARTIQDVFFEMVSDARYADENRVGIDGTSYHFSSFKIYFGLRCGRTWSPDENTPPFRLVSLSQTLFDYALADSSKDNIILERLRAQLRDFHR